MHLIDMKHVEQRIKATVLRHLIIVSIFLMMLAAAPVWGDAACGSHGHSESAHVSRSLEPVAGL